MAIIPKYRALTSEELSGLEKEFIDFLIVNGIAADDWVNLKKEEIDKAEDMITLFSDVVFEGIMRKVLFLDFISKSEIRTFQCLREKIVMVGMVTENETYDFSDPAFIMAASTHAPKDIKYIKSEKPYSKIRETELFEMTESGCLISDGRLFKALSIALV